MKKKDKIVISDKLLSWVFENKCGFKQMLNNRIFFSSSVYGLEKIEGVNYDGFDNSDPNDIDYFYYINIFEFIHLAKIKAFECGYHVLEKAYGSRVDWSINKCGCCYSKGKYFKNRTKQPMFGLDRIIEALEWVAEKVGGDNE